MPANLSWHIHLEVLKGPAEQSAGACSITLLKANQMQHEEKSRPIMHNSTVASA